MNTYPKTIRELASLLEKKEISAREITEHQLAEVEKEEKQVNAFITVCKQEALEQADRIDQKRAGKEALSPMAGVPIGIKDNICIKGIKNTCASKMLANFVPPYDATVVTKLKQEGAVLLGKLNMDEFAMGSSTETSYFGTAHNPHNLKYVPGGSSGGSTAAVAAGEVYGSLGTDTGGSIRQPAAFCGVVGLKPTYGRVSRWGAVAFASSLDQIGPIARTAYDTALLYRAIAGPDELDATSRKDLPPMQRLPQDDLAPLKGLTIGMPQEYFGDYVEEEVRDAVKQAGLLFEQNGSHLIETQFRDAIYVLPSYYVISCAEASSNLARFDGVRYGYRTPNYTNFTEMIEKSRSEGFGDEVKRRIMIGTFVLSSGHYDAYYKRAKVLQQDMIRLINDQLDKVDVILTPAVPNTAFPIGKEEEDSTKMCYNDFCTVIANIAGLPAISFPCGKDSHGLPVGAQLIGKHGDEERLLQIVHSFEMAFGGFDQTMQVEREAVL